MKAQSYFYTCDDGDRMLFALIKARDIDVAHEMLQEIVDEAAGCDKAREWNFVLNSDMDWEKKFLESHQVNTLYESLETEIGHA